MVLRLSAPPGDSLQAVQAFAGFRGRSRVKTRSLKLPPDLDSQLDEYARTRRVTRSSVVREAVAQYLARDVAPAARSVLARARDLAGSIDGPPDLSVNPEYLGGYGSARARRTRR
jgi:predicted DNA-binding protein